MEKIINQDVYSNRVVKHQEQGADLEFISKDGFSQLQEYFDSIELEKTAENILLINNFNNYLQEEVASLGIKMPAFPENKIKILEEEEFDYFAGEHIKTLGLYSAEADRILLKNPSLKMYHTLMHELVHYYSFHKIVFNDKDDLLIARLGYDETVAHNFKGFNEGITEYVASEILNKHQEEIKDSISDFDSDKVLDATKEEFFKPSVGRFSSFMKMLIDKISEKSGAPKEAVFAKFKNGLFTGNMMHLKEIENIFGKDSLRVLAYYDIYDSKETDLMIYNYFKNFEDENQKNKILNDLEKIRKASMN